MLNKSTSRSEYVVQSGVTQYPVGFEFLYNGDDAPQIRVTIGAMVAEENLHFVITEDLLNIKLIPLEEEAPSDPNDYSWLEKWVGMSLVIERDIPFVQESDYHLGRISPERIEKDFDLSVMRDQILDVKISDVHDEFTEAKAELQKSIDDKLPLAGGEVSGDVLFHGDIKLYDKYHRGATFTLGILGGMYIQTDTLTRFYFDDDFYVSNLEINEESNLGKESFPWSTAYVKKLNNGGVISIPEKAGTMALLEDLEGKADKTELQNYLPLTGGTLTNVLSFDVPGTAGKNIGLIDVKTASGMTPLIGAKTDDNGLLRDVAVIPKLQSETLSVSQILSNFIGSTSTPVTRIHAKKIGTGLISKLLTIPDGPGTIARLEDIPETYTKEELDAKFAEIPDSVDTYSKAEIDAKLSSVYKFKGSVANVEALPTDAVVGDTYNVEDTGDNYAWDGSAWDKLAGTFDVSNYYTIDEIDEQYADLVEYVGKQTRPIKSDIIQLTTNINTVAEWVRGPKDENGNRTALETEAQNAYAAINELNAKIGEGGGGAEIGPELDVELKFTSWFYGFNSSDGYFYFDNIYNADSPEDVSCFALTNQVYSGTPNISIVNRSYGISEDGQHYSFTEEWFGPGENFPKNLGREEAPWQTVYATKLNNGADLELPTEGGTLARIEDIDERIGDISTALTAILGE